MTDLTTMTEQEVTAWMNSHGQCASDAAATREAVNWYEEAGVNPALADRLRTIAERNEQYRLLHMAELDRGKDELLCRQARAENEQAAKRRAWEILRDKRNQHVDVGASELARCYQLAMDALEYDPFADPA